MKQTLSEFAKGLTDRGFWAVYGAGRENKNKRHCRIATVTLKYDEGCDDWRLRDERFGYFRVHEIKALTCT